MTAHWIEPVAVAEKVEAYVEKELTDAEKYSNRTPLDDSGIWSLHRLAAEIYAAAWEDAERAIAARNRGERLRARDQTKGDT